ncbi:hypothetical protein [Bacillus sp. KH172YL63]|uniref:hypothetical protein n=1 Tax=Bacillus sp. KH172YL63 TaxID=2709784 RepID=UPI0013E4ED0A|nr:hypothetical protein [Bacillus sp. KH172YL63]BCB03688.1 hypothetical protein KH172YL63_18210 [Bacillus sp. KH172YL63]
MFELSDLFTEPVKTVAINIAIVSLATLSLTTFIYTVLKFIKLPEKVIENMIGFIVVGVGISTVYYSLKWDLFLAL